MPQNIPDLYSWIHDVKYNKRITEQVLLEPTRDFLFDGSGDSVILCSRNEPKTNTNQYLLIDKTIGKIVYAVDYQINHDDILGDVISQTLVCRDKKYKKTFLVGIAQRVFWGYLYPQTECIATDSFQTDDGSHFWGWRLVEAFKKGLNVYFVDSIVNSIIKLNTTDDYNSLVDSFWGDSDEYQSKRLVITSKELDCKDEN